MKNLKLVMAVMFMIAAFVSCEKEKADELVSGDGQEKVVRVIDESLIPSTPESDGGITPYIIPGENPGGNRTCMEVAMAFETSFDLSTDRINYDEETESWDGEFPEGLTVTLDGIYISFSMENCIPIEGTYYKVGAVIIKGSEDANVYYYPTGTMGDSHLAAPGDKPMVSNITFCFIECEVEEELVVAVKSLYWYGDAYEMQEPSKITASKGLYPFSESPGWCYRLGVNYYPTTTTIPLWGSIGWVYLQEVWPEGIHSLRVTVDLIDNCMLDKTWLYVGSMEGLTEGDSQCPEYWNWLYQDDSDQNNHVFTIPFSDLNMGN